MRVKPLEWSDVSVRAPLFGEGSSPVGKITAETPLGRYTYMWIPWIPGGDLEARKAEAFAGYEATILGCLVDDRTMKVKPLEWSPERPCDEEVRYNHVIAETPFGRILITWKGWKTRDWPTIDEPHWLGSVLPYPDVAAAKQAAQEAFEQAVLECLEEVRDEQ